MNLGHMCTNSRLEVRFTGLVSASALEYTAFAIKVNHRDFHRKYHHAVWRKATL